MKKKRIIVSVVLGLVLSLVCLFYVKNTYADEVLRNASDETQDFYSRFRVNIPLLMSKEQEESLSRNEKYSFLRNQIINYYKNKGIYDYIDFSKSSYNYDSDRSPENGLGVYSLNERDGNVYGVKYEAFFTLPSGERGIGDYLDIKIPSLVKQEIDTYDEVYNFDDSDSDVYKNVVEIPRTTIGVRGIEEIEANKYRVGVVFSNEADEEVRLEMIVNKKNYYEPIQKITVGSLNEEDINNALKNAIVWKDPNLEVEYLNFYNYQVTKKGEQIAKVDVIINNKVVTVNVPLEIVQYDIGVMPLFTKVGDSKIEEKQKANMFYEKEFFYADILDELVDGNEVGLFIVPFDIKTKPNLNIPYLIDNKKINQSPLNLYVVVNQDENNKRTFDTLEFPVGTDKDVIKRALLDKLTYSTRASRFLKSKNFYELVNDRLEIIEEPISDTNIPGTYTVKIGAKFKEDDFALETKEIVDISYKLVATKTTNECCAKIEEILKELEKASNSNALQDEMIKSLREELKFLVEENDSRNNDLKYLIKEIQELQKATNSNSISVTDIEKLREEIEALKNENKLQNSTLEKFKDEILKASSSDAIKDSTIQELQKSITNLTLQLLSLDDKFKNDKENYDKKLIDLENTLTILKAIKVICENPCNTCSNKEQMKDNQSNTSNTGNNSQSQTNNGRGTNTSATILGTKVDELASLSNQIGRLTEKINNLKEDREDKIITRNAVYRSQWYPEKIVKAPKKIKYKYDDVLELEGLVVRFSRYVEHNGIRTKESKDVSLKELNNTYKGWKMVLNTTKADKEKVNNKKMLASISFILKDIEASRK